MNWHFRLLLIPISSFLLASEIDIVNSLETINKTLNSQVTRAIDNNCKQENITESTDEQLFLKCAQALCGPPKSHPVVTLNDFNFDRFVDDKIVKRFTEIEPDIAAIAKDHKRKNDLLIKKVESMISAESGTYDFSNMDNNYIDEFANLIFEPFISITIDQEKKIDQRIEIKITPPKNASNSFVQALNSYAKSRAKERLSFAAVYTRDELIKILNERLSDTLKKYNEEKNKNNPHLNSLPFASEKIIKFEEILKNGLLGQQANYQDLINDLDLIDSLLENAQNGLDYEQKKTFMCSEKPCIDGTKEYLRNLDLRKLISKFRLENDENSMVRQLKAKCKSTISSFAIKNTDKEKAKAQLPKILKQFQKNVLSSFSAESKKKFEKFMESEIDFDFEKPGSGNADIFIKLIHDIHKQTLANNETNNSDLDYMLKILRSKENEKVNPFSGLPVCEEVADIIWDTFTPTHLVNVNNPQSKNKLFISEFSCAYYQNGESIISHELGHALSFAFKNKKLSGESFQKFLKLRSCIRGLYKKESVSDPSFLSHKDDGITTEEDMADLISFIATPGNHTLNTCSFLQVDPTGENYINPSFEQYFVGDVHSASFMRLMNEAIHKKIALPASCQKVINKHKNSYRFKACF